MPPNFYGFLRYSTSSLLIEWGTPKWYKFWVFKYWNPWWLGRHGNRGSKQIGLEYTRMEGKTGEGLHRGIKTIIVFQFWTREFSVESFETAHDWFCDDQAPGNLRRLPETEGTPISHGPKISPIAFNDFHQELASFLFDILLKMWGAPMVSTQPFGGLFGCKAPVYAFIFSRVHLATSHRVRLQSSWCDAGRAATGRAEWCWCRGCLTGTAL